MSSPLHKFLEWEQRNPDRIFLKQPLEGQWETWTWRQAGDEARRVAHALVRMGLQPGDKVAILSKNCAHWILSDLAIMMAGMVSVPLYPTISAQTVEEILLHSGSKAIIIGKLDHYGSQAAGIPAQVEDIHIELYGTRGTHSWEAFVTNNSPLEHLANPTPDNVLTIIYTSGTTGNPKGVVHTVSNVMATMGQLDFIGLPMQPDVFSYLPLSHIAERIGIEMAGIHQGGCFSFAESLESFPHDLQATQPHYFFAVPRIWTKFREKINEKLPDPKLQRLLKIPIVSGLVKRKLKKAIGLSRAKCIFSGAAPISVDLLKWYHAIGIEILQAYGMTEDCIYCHINTNKANKFGTVGKPIPHLHGRISPEGEIQVKSPGLMKGYYREPELTAAAFTEDGYLRTGDLGEYDAEGFLRITGRLKDQFKTDKGKFISPSAIELKLQSDVWIEQVCVVGMGIPQPIALAVLPEGLLQKQDRHTIEKHLVTVLARVNATLQSYEKVGKIILLPEPWTIENGLMTPSLKIKRNELEKIHLGHYPSWYSLPGQVVWT